MLLHLDWLSQIPVPTENLQRTEDAIQPQSSDFTHFYLNGINFYSLFGDGFLYIFIIYLFCRIYFFKRPARTLVKGISKQLGI